MHSSGFILNGFRVRVPAAGRPPFTGEKFLFIRANWKITRDQRVVGGKKRKRERRGEKLGDNPAGKPRLFNRRNSKRSETKRTLFTAFIIYSTRPAGPGALFHHFLQDRCRLKTQCKNYWHKFAGDFLCCNTISGREPEKRRKIILEQFIHFRTFILEHL